MSDTALRYLQACAEHGSMRAAAEALSVAVSSISRQIGQLEAGLGVRLLETGRRTARLTDAGRLACEFHLAQVEQRRAFAARLDGLRRATSGAVRLALGDGAPIGCIQAALAAVQDRHAGIALGISAGRGEAVLRLVAEDDADIGLALASAPDPKLRIRAAAAQPMVLAVRPDHPLATRSGVTFADLCAHDLCLPDAGSRLRQLLAPAELRQQTWLSAAVTADTVERLRDIALTGQAAALVPRLAVQAEVEAGTLVTLSMPGLDVDAPDLLLVTRLGRQLAPAVILVLAALERQLARWSGGTPTARVAV